MTINQLTSQTCQNDLIIQGLFYIPMIFLYQEHFL